MPGSPFSAMQCSVAQTLTVIGERWTPLVLRDLAVGITRFERMQRNLGIPRKVLADRLATLTEEGIVERVPYQDNPPRHDYVLTQKGAELAMVIAAMQAWGDRWVYAEDGPPVVLRHEGCGQVAPLQMACGACGEPVQPGDVTPLPGPTFKVGPGTWETPLAGVLGDEGD